MTRLTFHGAAETVTGSKYLLEDGDSRVLIDCGLFQGLKELRQQNWEPPRFDIPQLNAIVLTHAHIDHIGWLPRVVKLGYRGPVYVTPPTVELAEIMLLDAARNQEDDAGYANDKRFSKHAPALPLYDSRDVEQSLKLMQGRDREAWFNPAGAIWCRYHDAGHLLGSTMIEVEVRSRTPALRILFSGDVGRYDAPLYHDPHQPPACDYLVCESTYGNRDHADINLLDELTTKVNEALSRGGVIVVPAFAVGRAQQLIYLLQVLIALERISELPIYLDSPMSVKANAVYLKNCSESDLTEATAAATGIGLRAANVHTTPTVEESKRINSIESGAVIIASSGMMTGGRILHHLRHRLGSARNTILLGGFQAEGTRGRQLQEGARFIRIQGQDVPVRAVVQEISALSGHAGRHELLRWLAPLPSPKQVFLTHGEKASAVAFAAELHETRGWNTLVPQMYQTVEL